MWGTIYVSSCRFLSICREQSTLLWSLELKGSLTWMYVRLGVTRILNLPLSVKRPLKFTWKPMSVYKSKFSVSYFFYFLDNDQLRIHGIGCPKKNGSRRDFMFHVLLPHLVHRATTVIVCTTQTRLICHARHVYLNMGKACEKVIVLMWVSWFIHSITRSLERIYLMGFTFPFRHITYDMVLSMYLDQCE